MEAHTQPRDTGYASPGPVHAMGSKVRLRLKSEVEGELSKAPGTRKTKDTTHRDRICTLVQIYSDLWAAGYRIETIRGLRPVHLNALIAHWQGRLKRDVALRRWNRLRAWCALIGKAGMVPTFESVWPTGSTVEPDKPRVTTTGGMSEDQYAWTLHQLKTSRKTVSYLVLRAVRELGLTREEALLLKPGKGLLADSRRVVTSHQRGKPNRAIHLDTAEKVDLVKEMVEHTRFTGRDVLGWPELTLKAQVARYAKHVQALNRKWEQQAGGRPNPIDEDKGLPSDSEKENVDA